MLTELLGYCLTAVKIPKEYNVCCVTEKNVITISTVNQLLHFLANINNRKFATRLTHFCNCIFKIGRFSVRGCHFLLTRGCCIQHSELCRVCIDIALAKITYEHLAVIKSNSYIFSAYLAVKCSELHSLSSVLERSQCFYVSVRVEYRQWCIHKRSVLQGNEWVSEWIHRL